MPRAARIEIRRGLDPGSAAWGRVLCGLLFAAFLGCTTPAKYTIAEGHEGAPGVRRVLLCPMNVAVSLPSEIWGGAEPVHRELGAYLRERGIEVAHLSLPEARRRWRDAVTVAARTKSGDAASIFARDLEAWLGFDAMLMPSLVLQGVRVTDSSGTWDGVRRRVDMVNLPSRGMGVESDTFTKGIAFGGIAGSVMATSLHVMAYSADGQRVFEGQGGLDFVQEADLAGAHDYTWELRMKSGLLRDPEVLREGVEIALGPYLPPSDDL